MNNSYSRMAKYFNLVNSIFVNLLLILFFYFLIHGTYQYYQTENGKFLFELFYALILIIWISIILHISSKIELKLYKEDFSNLLELLILHAILLGVINPLAFYDYYLLYNLNVKLGKNISIKVDVIDKEYYVSKLLIKIGIYFFIYYIIKKYYDLYKSIYYLYQDRIDSISGYQIFYALFLIICLFQVKVAEKEINQQKYLFSAIRIALVAILANPFSFHGLLFLISSGMMFYYQDKSGKLKEKFNELKKRFTKDK